MKNIGLEEHSYLSIAIRKIARALILFVSNNYIQAVVLPENRCDWRKKILLNKLFILVERNMPVATYIMKLLE